eukprot:m.36600 g.36600  ORF g.36600 m.36600 type:complete len:97 (+) comp32264_c0_seq2:261-551(+)
MLWQVAQHNPQVLALLGGSMSQLQAERSKVARVQDLRKLSPEDKKTKDRELWSQWLKKYRMRLLKEVEGESVSLDEVMQFFELCNNLVTFGLASAQ